MDGLESDKIYNMDCLEGMKHIPDGSIDAIICDLPYGVLNSESEGGGWDSIIPFKPLWDQYLRIAKPTAPIILFGSGMFTAELMLSKPNLWRYNLIWEKGRISGFLNANRMPLRSHEDIAVFYWKLPTYNPQMQKGDSHGRGKGYHEQTNKCYGSFKETKNIEPKELVYPKSVLHFGKEHSEDTWHPTQKPVDLLRYLIRTYSNEGDTILDNCMGSGTTAVACIKEKRHFIGFELNKEYFDKACKRIDAERRQLTLF